MVKLLYVLGFLVALLVGAVVLYAGFRYWLGTQSAAALKRDATSETPEAPRWERAPRFAQLRKFGFRGFSDDEDADRSQPTTLWTKVDGYPVRISWERERRPFVLLQVVALGQDVSPADQERLTAAGNDPNARFTAMGFEQRDYDDAPSLSLRTADQLYQRAQSFVSILRHEGIEPFPVKW